jgi:hypothetical protein
MSAKKARKTSPRKPATSPATARRTRAKPGKTPKKGRSVVRAKRALSPLEVQLRKALAEMGLARARRVFAAVEASFDD